MFGSGTDPWQSANPLSSGGFAATSAFVITGSISSLTSGSGTIFSDDGAVLRQAGVNLGGNDLPQSATSANYLNLALGTFEILYIETNGLPANLIVKSDGTALSDVPLPAALPLFASGLGALGLLGWRRKRKNVAAIAA